MLVTRTQEQEATQTAAEGSRLARLYEEHAPAAARLAYLLTGDRAAAEDLVQEAFIRVTGRTLRVSEPYAFRGYLRRTIINLHTSHQRRRKVERAYLEREAAHPLAHETAMPDFEGREEMWERLLGLPARQRAALILRYYEDLSEGDTAEVLGCSRTAAKSLIRRALEALRNDMREETDHG